MLHSQDLKLSLYFRASSTWCIFSAGVVAMAATDQGIIYEGAFGRGELGQDAAMTLQHLLTHTAGFSYEMWSADIVKYQEVTGTPGITTCENAALTRSLHN